MALYAGLRMGQGVIVEIFLTGLIEAKIVKIFQWTIYFDDFTYLTMVMQDRV